MQDASHDVVLGSRGLFQIAALAFLTAGIRVALFLGWSGHWNLQDELVWDGWGRIASFAAAGYGLSDTHLVTYFAMGPDPIPTAARAPVPLLLFAAVIRLFGVKLLPIVVLQAVIDAGTALVTYFLARRLIETGTIPSSAGPGTAHRAGLIAGAGYALFVPEWRYAIGFQSEPVFTLVVTAALAGFMLGRTAPHLAWTGALFGLAVLARPAVLPLTPILVAWLVLVRRIPVRRAAIALLLTGLVLVPWAVRNYLVLGRPIVTQTLLGYDLYRHSGAIDGPDYVRWVSVEEAEDRIRALVASHGTSLDALSETALDRLLTGEALRIIGNHPGRYLNLTLHRAGWLFYDPMVGTGLGTWLRVLCFAFLLVPFGIVAVMVARGPTSWVLRSGPVWLMVGYMIVVHALLVAQCRYLLPVMPSVISVAAHGIMHAVQAFWGSGETDAVRLTC